MSTKKIIIGVVLIGLIALSFFYKDAFIAFIEDLRMNSSENLLMTISVLIGAKIVSAVALLPGSPLTLLTGSLLPFVTATLTAWVGNLLGATCAFLVGRYLLFNYLQEKVLPKYPRLEEFDKRIAQNGLATVIAIRLIPVFPFNVINYLLGITSLKTKDYIVGSAIGLLPGTAAFVYLGNALGALSPINIAGAIIGLVVLTYIGKKIEKKNA